VYVTVPSTGGIWSRSTIAEELKVASGAGTATIRDTRERKTMAKTLLMAENSIMKDGIRPWSLVVVRG